MAMRKSAKLAALKEKQKQEAIHAELARDLFRLVARFVGIAAAMAAAMALFGVPFNWDLVAILLSLTGFIVLKYMSKKG